MPAAAPPVPAGQAEGATPARVRGLTTLAGDVASMFGSRAASIVLSFVSVLITTRLLGPVGYGQVAYFTVVAMLIFTITSGWTSTTVARYGREELEHDGHLVTTSWNRIALVAPLFALAALVIPALKLAGAFPPEFTWTFVWLVVAYGAIMVAAEHIRNTLEASGRMKLSALGMLLQQAGFVAAVAVVAVSGLPRTPLMVIVVSMGAVTAVAILFGHAVFRSALWPPRFDRVLLRRMLMFSLPLVAFTLSQYVIQAVDLIVIRVFKSAAEVGVYAFAYQTFISVQALATVAPQILTPLFVSARTARRESLVARYFERIVPQVAFLGSALLGLAIPLLVFLVPALFGDDFSGATRPLAILLVALLVALVANLLAPVIVLYERTRAVAVINIVAAVVNVGGDVILLGPLDAGIIAAAYASLAAFLIIAVGYHLVARSCLGSRAPLNPLLFVPAVAALVPVLVLSGATAVIVGVAASVACTVAILLLGRIFEPADREIIEGIGMPAAVKRAALRVLGAVTR